MLETCWRSVSFVVIRSISLRYIQVLEEGSPTTVIQYFILTLQTLRHNSFRIVLPIVRILITLRRVIYHQACRLLSRLLPSGLGPNTLQRYLCPRRRYSSS